MDYITYQDYWQQVRALANEARTIRAAGDGGEADGESRLHKVVYRVLAPTAELARLNLQHEAPGVRSILSIAAARKPIGQHVSVVEESAELTYSAFPRS